MNGTTRAPFGRSAEPRADDAATQADGRIVLSGYVARWEVGPDGERKYHRHIAVVRFLPSGRPDRSFGGDGVVVTRRGGRGSEVAALPDGGLLIAGRTGDQVPLLLRLRRDGTLDRRFGQAGAVSVDLRGRSHPEPVAGGVTDLVFQPGGGVVLAVYAGFDRARRASMLVRYGVDGRLDRSFGGDGVVDFEAPGVRPEIDSLAVLPGGELLAVAPTQAYPSRIALVGLRPDGRLDRTYGGDGVAVGPEALRLNFDVAFTADRDGNAVVAAASPADPSSFFLVRFTPTGGLSAFGGLGGGVTPPLPGEGPYSVVARPGGDVLVLSFEANPPRAPLVARFRFEDGSLSIWPGPGQMRPR